MRVRYSLARLLILSALPALPARPIVPGLSDLPVYLPFFEPVNVALLAQPATRFKSYQLSFDPLP